MGEVSSLSLTFLCAGREMECLGNRLPLGGTGVQEVLPM